MIMCDNVSHVMMKERDIVYDNLLNTVVNNVPTIFFNAFSYVTVNIGNNVSKIVNDVVANSIYNNLKLQHIQFKVKSSVLNSLTSH